MTPTPGVFPPAIAIVRQAVAQWREAVRAHDKDYRLIHAEGESASHSNANTWEDVCCWRLHQAESHLVTCILALSDRGRSRDYRRAMNRGWAPHGLALDGFFYLVVPFDENGPPEGVESKTNAIRLVVLPVADVVAIGPEKGGQG